MNKEFFKKMLNIDRRWIYLLIFIVVAIPLIKPLGLKTYPTPPVQSVFKYIDKLGPNDAILLAINYDGSTMPELHPMARAILRHAFLRNVKVLGFSFYPASSAISQTLIPEVAEQYGKKDGVDYVNFGYKTPLLPIILGMSKSIVNVMQSDINGVPLKDLPIMKKIRNYNDVDLIVDFTGAATYAAWITYVETKYGVHVASGITGVSGAQLYPYIDSGQLVGALIGLKGGAEYEKLVDDLEEKLHFTNKRKNIVAKLLRKKNPNANIKREWRLIRLKDMQARTGMDAQAVAHLVIILFIIIGNIGFFAIGQHKKRIGG